MPAGIFDAFDRVDLTYKIVHEHRLEVTVLTPKTLQSKPSAEYPVLVHWHGGGFVVGHRMYEAWFPPWLVDLCLTTPALLITPSYRLLPESSGPSLLTDLESFWHWLHTTLPAHTTTWHARPNPSHLACTGSSAGAYLAVHSALLFPSLSRIKCLISIAGALNHDIPFYRTPAPRLILGKRPPPPWKAEKLVREYVRGLEEGVVRTEGDPVEMWEFLTCVLQQGYLPRWLGWWRDERLDAMKMVEKVEGVPPVWVVQGEQDSVVPAICSTGFVDKLKHVRPDVPVLLSLRPGEHGFEVMHSAEDEWVREGLEFVKRYWP